MWKIVLGFIVFAAISLFVIMKGGDKLDMSGEKHGTETAHEEKKPEAAAPSAPAPATPVATPAANEAPKKP